MKTAIGIVVLGVVVVGLYVLNDVTRSEEGASLLHVAEEMPLEVETTIPERRAISRTVQAPGEVEPIEEVDISSELVSKIVEMPVEEGDLVAEGDLLCRLDDADFKARLLSAEANVARLRAFIRQADADVEQAQLDYDQEKRLIEVGGTSIDTVNRFRTALVSAQAMLEMRKHELKAAQASLQSAREDLAKTVIEAPLSGIVSQLFAEQGEVVVTGTMNNPGTRIMVVSDLSKMQVRCRVDEADAALVRADQRAHIYLQSDTRKSIPGRVLRVGTKGTKPVGRDVVTFETLVLIEGDDPRVRPGMTANVEIEVARRDEALVVPIQSVVHRRRRDLPEALVRKHDDKLAALEEAERPSQAEYVRILFCVADDEAEARLVETGINDALGVEITEGINPDDEVVIGPYRSLDQLKHGSRIKRMEKAAPDAESAGEEGDEEANPEPSTGAGAPDGAAEPDESDSADEGAQPAQAAAGGGGA